MKIKAVICAVTALSMGFSGLAFGQNDKDLRSERQYGTAVPQAGARHQDRRDDRVRAPQRAWRDQGRDHARDDRREWRYREVPRAYYRDGPGHGHRFYRGGRLPYEYRSHQYVVDDWRAHHLRRPPRGYQWVQAGPDYLLVAIASGVIASILLNQ